MSIDRTHMKKNSIPTQYFKKGGIYSRVTHELVKEVTSEEQRKVLVEMIQNGKIKHIILGVNAPSNHQDHCPEFDEEITKEREERQVHALSDMLDKNELVVGLRYVKNR